MWSEIDSMGMRIWVGWCVHGAVMYVRNGDVGFHEGGDIHGIKKWVCMEERLKRWMKI